MSSDLQPPSRALLPEHHPSWCTWEGCYALTTFVVLDIRALVHLHLLSSKAQTLNSGEWTRGICQFASRYQLSRPVLRSTHCSVSMVRTGLALQCQGQRKWQ